MTMHRREFLTLLGGAAAAWPLAARAQQPAMPVIGYLNSSSPTAAADRLRGFRQGLSEAGFVEGRNVAIEFRFAELQNDRLPALAADLVRRQVAVIAGVNSTEGALVAKAATTTIPIVFQVGGDPVKNGLVASLNRPGGNVTGASNLTNELGPKRLGLLRDLLPNVGLIAALVNPTNPNAESDAKDLLAAAQSIGMTLNVIQSSRAGVPRRPPLCPRRPANGGSLRASGERRRRRGKGGGAETGSWGALLLDPPRRQGRVASTARGVAACLGGLLLTKPFLLTTQAGTSAANTKAPTSR
jgi:hypothetical protein